MRHQTWRCLIVAASLVMCAGCATTRMRGISFGPERMSHIQAGMPEEGLVSLLGKPTRIQERSSGRRLLSYEFVQTHANHNLWNGRVKTTIYTKTLHVLIDQGRVLDHTLTEWTTRTDELDVMRAAYYPIIIPIPL